MQVEFLGQLEPSYKKLGLHRTRGMYLFIIVVVFFHLDYHTIHCLKESCIDLYDIRKCQLYVLDHTIYVNVNDR